MNDAGPRGRTREGAGVVIWSHNTMHGHHLERLIEEYTAWREDGPSIFCVQEATQGHDGARDVERLLAWLGPQWEAAESYDNPQPRRDVGNATLFDRAVWRPRGQDVVRLAQLERLSAFERVYVQGGRPDQKNAIITHLERTDGLRVAVCNFHLDSAGTTEHRRAQVQSIADALRARVEPGEAIVACGDTNAWAFGGVRRRREALRTIIEPLGALGALDAGSEDTYSFARLSEPPNGPRVQLLARLIGDRPSRFDVLCTTLRARACGVRVTPWSDHALVWGALDT